MNKFITRIQDIGQKATQIKQAVQSVPPKIADIRQAVTATAGQLVQLRADVQSTVNSLRTEGEDRLTEALREIDGGAEVFHEAGYAVVEVEMEMGLAQRLIVHLEKIGDVPHAVIRSLLGANESRETIHGILTALLKAEELAGTVNLTKLTYHKLAVYLGLTPSMRLCWQDASIVAAEEIPAHQPPSAPPAPSPVTSMFGPGSFFERPAASVASPVLPPAAAPAVAAATEQTPVVQNLPAVASASPSETGDWRHDVLARFKKMPDLSKPRR